MPVWMSYQKFGQVSDKCETNVRQTRDRCWICVDRCWICVVMPRKYKYNAYSIISSEVLSRSIVLIENERMFLAIAIAIVNTTGYRLGKLI